MTSITGEFTPWPQDEEDEDEEDEFEDEDFDDEDFEEDEFASPGDSDAAQARWERGRNS